MILTRVEKDNQVEALYESSNIISSKYDKGTNKLSLVFKGGTEYIYENVDISDYHKLELADSQGVAFNKYLRSYPFVKGDKVDIIALHKRLEDAKQAEIDALTVNIVELSNLIANEYSTTGDVSEINLNDMIRLIEYRKKRFKK